MNGVYGGICVCIVHSVYTTIQTNCTECTIHIYYHSNKLYIVSIYYHSNKLPHIGGICVCIVHSGNLFEW